MIRNIDRKYLPTIFSRNAPPTPCRCENNLATILQRVSSSAMKFTHRWTMAINIHTVKASVLKFRRSYYKLFSTIPYAREFWQSYGYFRRK